MDIIGQYRTAERVLTRRLQPLIGKPGQSSSPVGKQLNHHANECARHILSLSDVQDAQHQTAVDQRSLVEAFPSSFLGMMLEEPEQYEVRRGNRSDIFFEQLAASGVLEQLIKHCLPQRRLASDLNSVTNHDDRAALVCAFSALCVAAMSFVTVGDENGWIILPPRPLIQLPQWSLLVANAAEEAGQTLHIYSADS